MGFGTASSGGFQYFANNAVDLIAGTQAASSAMVSANIQETAGLLHADLGRVNSTLFAQTEKLAGINSVGFNKLGETMSKGFSSLEALSGASLAVQAAGFALVAKQLHSVNGNIKAMHKDLAEQGRKLIAVQEAANARLESLVSYASRTLETQERILATLVSSKTIEAQQFIRQGWDNLLNGYDDDAFARFQKSLDYDNTVYVAHAELGRLFEARKDDAKAEDHFRRATKFAGLASPKLQAFSHVQFAGFLERKARLKDALQEVGAALNAGEVDARTRGGWLLYKAELLATGGDSAGAVSTAREAVGVDDSFFLGAMASDVLAKTQPELTRMLVRLDQDRRAPIVATFQSVGKKLDTLEVLSAEVASAMRSVAAQQFESFLLQPFDALPEAKRQAEKLEADTDAAIAQMANKIIADVRARRDSVAASFGSGPLPSARALAPFWTAGKFVAIGVVVLLAIATEGLGLCLGIPVLGIWFGLAFNSRNKADLAARTAAVSDWNRWRTGLVPSVKEWEREREIARIKLESAEMGVELWGRVSADVDRLTPPALPGKPTWFPPGAVVEDVAPSLPPSPRTLAPSSALPATSVAATSDMTACPHCGQPIKAAARICKHCREAVA